MVVYDSYKKIYVVTKNFYYFTGIFNVIKHKKWNLRKMISNIITVVSGSEPDKKIKDDIIKNSRIKCLNFELKCI